MYTTISNILKDAVRRKYAVVACSAINMEMARGIVSAASRANAPIIFLLGQNMMRKIASAELVVPMIRTMAGSAHVPIAACLDHGNDEERIMYSIRNGFSSIMFDGSLYPLDENIARTRDIVRICHSLGMAVEGEIGHVGVAADGDNANVSYYTDPDEACRFVSATGVDALAVSVGTAHGDYPKGVTPHIAFDIIERIHKAIPDTPLVLHGGSGSGDENIRRAVAAGISKINVVTDFLNAGRNHLMEATASNPKIGYMDLMNGMEDAVSEAVCHWIGLSGSEGKACLYHFRDTFDSFLYRPVSGKGE